MPMYRKKPVEARLYDPDAPNATDILEWSGLSAGVLYGGEYVIKLHNGDVRFATPELFDATYEPVQL